MKKRILLLLVMCLATQYSVHAISPKQIVSDVASPIIDATKLVGTWMYRHPLSAMAFTNIPALLFFVASVSSYQSCAKSIDSYQSLYACQNQFETKIAAGAITYVGLNGLLYLHAITAPVIDGITLTGKWIYRHPKFCLLTAAAIAAASVASTDI